MVISFNSKKIEEDGMQSFSSPFTKTLFASSVAAIVSRVIWHPIDTVRVRMQCQRRETSQMNTNVNGNTIINKHYKNILEAIITIIKFEGLKGLYRGCGYAILLSAPANSLFLTSYEVFKSILLDWTSFSKSQKNNNQQNLELSSTTDGEKWTVKSGTNIDSNAPPPFVSLTCGFLAESVSSILWTPQDVLKERLQVQRILKSSRFHTGTETSMTSKSTPSMTAGNYFFQTIREKNGLRSLYKGYWLTLGSFGPASSIYLYLYEQLKSKTNMPPLLSASLANVVASLVTNPLDVIKTRIQTDRTRIAGISSSKGILNSNLVDERNGKGFGFGYTSFYDGLKKMIQTEGPLALWKGSSARMIYSAANAATIMSIFESIKAY